VNNTGTGLQLLVIIGPLMINAVATTVFAEGCNMSANPSIAGPVEGTTVSPASGTPAQLLALLIDGTWEIPAGSLNAEAVRRVPTGLKASWHDGALWIETPNGPGGTVRLTPRADAIVVLDGAFGIPPGVTDLGSFRQWIYAEEEEIYRRVRLTYIDGVLWVDRFMEELYWHNDVKAEVNGVLRQLVKRSGSGRYFDDRAALTCPEVNLSTEPDGMFVTFDAFDTGRVRETPSVAGGFIEVEGGPEMVLEVLSPSTVRKDTIELPPRYFQAGITEFWRVDARGGRLIFEIFRRGATTWEPMQPDGDWLRSAVFGHDFRLLMRPDRRGNPLYTLEMR
jgi:Uma2 family endonuclease